MDLEQITNETLDKVERLDRNLREFMDKNESTGSASGLTNCSANLNTLGNTICNNIKGSSDVDLTKINENVNKIASYIDGNILTEEFQEDPFKLDEEYVGYTPGGTTFNTTDSIECLKSFTMNNENGKNASNYLRFFSVYCEGDTFNVKIYCDLETETETTLELEFSNTTIGTTSITKKSYPIAVGRNIINEIIEDVNVSTLGNYVKIKFNKKGITVNSYKIEVVGKNVKILSKPSKFKVFSKNGTTLISKLEDNNGYCLELDSNKLNPANLEKSFKLVKENVIDFGAIFGKYKYNTLTFNSPLCYSYIDLEGAPFNKVGNSDTLLFPTIYKSENLSLQDNTNTYAFFKNFFIEMNSYIRLAYGKNTITSTSDYSFLIASQDDISRITTIIDNYNETVATASDKIILMKKDGTNMLYFKISSSATMLDLGKGTNVTAYFDKNTNKLVRVYMKIGDKMVRKTVLFETTTDDSGSSSETGTIIEQKIIGTYDFYFETENECYFVVKDDKIYMFKN
ncbi:MAG: hypothetical protein ACI4TI_01555 [Christensenellales bacterium]